MSQQINLYNPIFLKEEKYFSARTMLQALGLIGAGLIAIWAYAAYQTARLQDFAAEADRQLAEQRASLIRLTTQYSPEGAVKDLQPEIHRVESQIQSAEQLLSSLRSREFGQAAAFSEYLTAFSRQALPGVWLTGFVIAGDGNELSIRGRVLRADLVPAYLSALNKESVMRGRSVTMLQLTGRDDGAERGPARGAAERVPVNAGPARYVDFSITAPRTVSSGGDAKAGGAGS